VHRSEFLKAARDLGVNLILHPAHVNSQAAGKTENLLRRTKRWLYFKFPEFSLFVLTFKHAAAHARAFIRNKPDVVLLRYTVHFSAIILARMLRIPVVLEVNCPYYLHSRYELVNLRFIGFWKWLERKAIDLASSVVVISKPLKDYYITRGFSAEKFAVVPNAVNLSRFDPSAFSGAEIKRLYGLDDSFVIGFVGRLEEWSGIDWFLRSLTLIRSVLRNVIVVVIGSGPLEGRLREIIADLQLEKHVRLVGHVPHEEIPRYMACFDIAVAPYRYVELFYGSPMKIFEYLAMGKPVLTARMGQSMDLIRHGENGFFYEPDDAKEMLDALSLLIRDSNLRQSLGREAYISSRNIAWTWERNATAIIDVCRAAASNKRSFQGA